MHTAMNLCVIAVVLANMISAIMYSVECTSTAEENSVFVVPENVDRSSYSQERLYTISELAEVTNFGSNTTIYFLPGEHITGDHDHDVMTIVLWDKDNVTLTGAYDNCSAVPIIECTGPFALAFGLVTNLTISCLIFNNCGAPYYPINGYFATIFISSCTHVVIDRVTIANGTGIGLLVQDVFDYLRISNTIMTHNNINCHIGASRDSRVALCYYQASLQLAILNSEFTFGRLVEEDVSETEFDIDASGITALFYCYDHVQVKIVNITLDSNDGYCGNFFLKQIMVSSAKNSSLTVNIQNLKSLNASGKNSYSLSVRYSEVKSVNITITDSTFVDKRLAIGQVIDYSNVNGDIASNNYLHYVSLCNVSIHGTTANPQESPQVSLSLYKVRNAFLTICTVVGNTLPVSILIFDSYVTLQGHNVLSHNRGGIVVENNSTLEFDSYSVTHITNNLLTDKDLSLSVLLVHTSRIVLNRSSSVRFANNSVLGCGGIMAVKSTLRFLKNSTVLFSDNSGNNGGAMALYGKSQLFFFENGITIRFIRNRARNKGGAIFVEDSGYVDSIHFKYILAPIILLYKIMFPSKIVFKNNTADIAGDEIFGGWIDWPYREITEYSRPDEFEYFYDNRVFRIHHGLSVISSNPVRICLCFNSTPNCNITNHTVWMFPGQALQLEAVAVGQQYGVVPTTVLAEFQNLSLIKGSFAKGQNVQSTGKYCTPLEYTILSANMFESILLRPSIDQESIPILPMDEALRELLIRRQPLVFAQLSTLFSQLSISVHLKQCPLGYVFNHTSNSCACHQSLQGRGIVCNTTDFSIWRPGTKWINATIVHTTFIDELVVIVHDHCPFDYCNSESNSLQLETPDDQCYFNRSGTLCGACRDNLSLVFGTSNCKDCSSLWVLLLVPVVILLGVALIIFLMVLDVTVSIGTINGLIFYANIVRANQAVFFPANSANSFLSWFIAWLNLDLGIDSCFYNGLDSYVKTWLQFFFPVYIWLLVISIIVSSRYSLRVSRVIGTNAVSVLATLILLSYTKVLRTIITVFQYTELEYSNRERKKVWVYDGNIEYLQGRHIPLFLAALFFLIFLSIPYTATLLEIRWLRKLVCTTCDSCLNLWAGRFMPILDAHSGPYKDEYRYWTGLLLLIRVALLLVFSLNLSGDPSVNLIAISVTVLCLLSYFSLIGGPYKSWPINVIEVSFYLNTGLLSSATLYKVKGEGNSTDVTFLSTSVALVSFTVILFYHSLKRLVSTKRGAEWKKAVLKRAKTLLRRQEAEDTGEMTPCGRATREMATRTVIELREPLLRDLTQNKSSSI